MSAPAWARETAVLASRGVLRRSESRIGRRLCGCLVSTSRSGRAMLLAEADVGDEDEPVESAVAFHPRAGPAGRCRRRRRRWGEVVLFSGKAGREAGLRGQARAGFGLLQRLVDGELKTPGMEATSLRTPSPGQRKSG